jgi:hypothetical protein
MLSGIFESVLCRHFCDMWPLWISEVLFFHTGLMARGSETNELSQTLKVKIFIRSKKMLEKMQKSCHLGLI